MSSYILLILHSFKSTINLYIIDFFIVNFFLKFFFVAMEKYDVSKIFAIAELLVPTVMHYFDLSLVEMLINGRFIYAVKSDFSTVLFYVSMSMIFQALRRKNFDVINFQLKLIGMVIFIKIFFMTLCKLRLS